MQRLGESHSLELRLHLYNLADVGVAGRHALVLLLHPGNLSCALLLLGANIFGALLRKDFGVGGFAYDGVGACLDHVGGGSLNLVELFVGEGGLVLDEGLDGGFWGEVGLHVGVVHLDGAALRRFLFAAAREGDLFHYTRIKLIESGLLSIGVSRTSSCLTGEAFSELSFWIVYSFGDATSVTSARF